MTKRIKRIQYPNFKKNVATKFNISEFYSLLRHANLELEEKKEIIERIPDLPAFKVEELFITLKNLETKTSQNSELAKDWNTLSKIYNLPETQPQETTLKTEFSIILKRVLSKVKGQGNQEVVSSIAALFYLKSSQLSQARGRGLFKDQNTQLQGQPPILLSGPTGSGKTHLIDTLEKEFSSLNFVRIDASNLVRTGIHGLSTDDLGRIIWDTNETKRQQSIHAEHSVVVFDEFDKLLSNPESREILNQILTIIEASSPLRVMKLDQRNQTEYPKELPTKNLLFILMGSFEVYQNRSKSNIGFTSEKETYAQIDSNYLANLNMPPELRGRISKIFTMKNNIDDASYLEILTSSERSPLVQLQKRLQFIGHELIFNQNELLNVIKQANTEELGMRGLFNEFSQLSQVDEILIDALHQSTPKTYQLKIKY